MIITGANNGIGLECVHQFLDENWHVAAISRKSNNLKLINNNKLNIYECDVTNYGDLKNQIAKIRDNYQIINGLINNAGVAFYDDIVNLEHCQIQNMIDINIQGFTNVLELVLPIMQQQHLGTILNMSSLADRYPRPKSPVYAATKAYVKSPSDSLRISNAKHNIRIMNLSPAIIDTPLLQSIKRVNNGHITTTDFVNVIKFMFNLPQSINIRDLVIAPTEYEN